MNCVNCNKSFHYCNSCDPDADADIGVCSSSCFLDILKSMSIEQMARLLVQENANIYTEEFIAKVNANRAEVAEAVLREIYS